MVKKIILWALFAGFAGALVFGAVNRAEARNDSVESGVGRNAGGGKEQAGSEEGGQAQLANGQGEDQVGRGNGGQGQEAQGQGQGEQNLSEQQTHDWVSYEGVVLSVSPDVLQVSTTDGQVIEIVDRAWRYAQESGFYAAEGDQVQLEGFYEEGKFEAAAINDMTNGLSVALRDETGRPLWAGGQGSAGQGAKGNGNGARGSGAD